MLRFVVSLACAAWLPASAAMAGPTTNFTLTGDVGTPGTYTLSSLALLPATTEQATYLAAGHSVTDIYTGVLLWNLLGAAGGVTVDPSVKNDVLRHYLVGTGSDGYTAVIAAGEIAPKFGNRPYLAAYSDTGGQLTPTPGPDGFARWVLPKDVAGGRYVSNLANIAVGSVSGAASQGGGLSTRFTVEGGVKHPGTYKLATLQGLPASSVTATYLAGGHSVTDMYTGVSLWTLLTDAGIVTDATIKNDVLRKLVVATGSDGYSAVFSLGEIDPAFGNQLDLVAYSDTGGQLGSGGADGFARLVVPGDLAGGRYISNLVDLRVVDVTAAPEPGSAALLVVPLVGVVGLLRMRRAA